MSTNDATETDETTTPRCRTCGRREVTEHTYDCPACLHAIRTDLAEIARMYAHLPAEVEHRGVNSEAMNLLGPASDPEARGHLEASILAGRVRADMLEDGTGSHPLTVTADWAMRARDTLSHDEPHEWATVEGESAYLRDQLTDLSRAEWFEMDGPTGMAAAVRKCRAHMESVLHDGEQIERGAPCPNLEHEDDDHKPPRLVKRYQDDDHTGARDQWCCPGCRTCWTDAEYRLRVADDYRANAESLTAGDMQRQYDVKPGTLRKWAAEGKVKRRGYDGSGRQMYDVAGVKAMQKQDEVAA